MLQSVKVAAVVALAVGFGSVSASAQEASANSPAAAKTDPAKPEGDATMNTMVPFGVNPPVPNTSTPEATDSVRPPTTGERLPVPQGSFTAESPNPATPAATEPAK